MKPTRSLAPVSLLLSLACLLAVGDAPAATPPAVTVVMSGLDNPRGLALGRNGTLYVAEAGRGGTGPCALTGRTSRISAPAPVSVR
jgi:hypothetical protein